MHSLLLAVVLAQAPALPPATAEVADTEPAWRSPTHFAGAFAGALIGAAPGVALFAGAITLSTSRTMAGVIAAEPLKPLSLVLLATGIGVGGYLGHRLTGGRGHWMTALISAGAATAVSLFAVMMYTFVVDNPWWNAQQRFAYQGPAVIAGAALPVLVVATALQIHHHKKLNVAVAPVPGGGGAVSLSGAF